MCAVLHGRCSCADSHLNASASAAAFGFVVVLMCVAVLRVLHQVLCVYFDHQMESASVPLETVWTHVTGGTRKTTYRFDTTDDSLRDLAGNRDEVGDDKDDVSLQLMEDTPSDVGGSSTESTEAIEVDSFSSDSNSTPPSRAQYNGIASVRNGELNDLPDSDDVGGESWSTPPSNTLLEMGSTESDDGTAVHSKGSTETSLASLSSVVDSSDSL